MPADKAYWFPAKRYGYGWGAPSRWQGWVTLLVWLATVIAAGVRLMPYRTGMFLLIVTAATAALVLVCYMKGEPAAWRWGEGSDTRRPRNE